MELKAILLSGIAGAGKSTWALNYVKEHDNVAILSTDEVRFSMYGTYTPTEDSQKKVIREIMQRASEYANLGISVIVDTAVVVNRNRIKWYNRLRSFYKNIELVIIDTPLETCIEQNNKRTRHVPEKVINQMQSIKEEPSEEVKKLFSKITVVKHQ